MANQERAEKIKHWMEMGLQGLAEQMWVTWSQNKKLREEARRRICNARKEDKRKEAKLEAYETLLKENERLKDILQDNGIRPKKLEVTYIADDCQHCQFYNRLEDACEGNIWGDDCITKEVRETVSFYSYKIDDDALSGITADFKEEEFNALEVRDGKTGKVLYEYKEEKEE